MILIMIHYQLILIYKYNDSIGNDNGEIDNHGMYEI
jgi:hypothetical protein